MHVLILGSYAPSLINFRGPLLSDLVAGGHRVTACAPDIGPDIAEALRRIGAVPCSVPMGRTGRNPLADLETLVALWRLFRRVRPDLVLTYTAKPNVYGTLAARAAGVPRRVALVTGLGYAFAEGGEAGRRTLRALLSGLYRTAFRAAHAVVFQNPDDRAEFVRRGITGHGQDCAVVPGSGIDLERFVAAPVPDGPPVFLMIARLIRDKGIVELAEAAKIVKAVRPDAEIRLLGPPDDNPNGVGRDLLRAWQDRQLIRYLGETTDVRPHLRSCMVYVLPSYYREGLPRTILEAMAIGRAVVTTDMPGCRETVVDGRNGFLVRPRDAEALAGAMLRFVAEPRIAADMGAQSRRLAEERFDVKTVNAAMMHAMGLA
jgi:glycosyltransferase involved in cell wall biosynthesis